MTCHGDLLKAIIWTRASSRFGCLSSVWTIVIIQIGCWLVSCPAQPFSMYADVAQLVEHGIRNTGVMGSNPIVGFMIRSWQAVRTFLFAGAVCGIVAST